MWTYLDAWAGAAKALGVEIAGPVTVEVAGQPFRAELQVLKFGGPRGTLIFANYEDWSGRWPELKGAGFAASTIDLEPEGVEVAVDDMIDHLSDWGWSGEGPAPEWLQNPPAA